MLVDRLRLFKRHGLATASGRSPRLLRALRLIPRT